MLLARPKAGSSLGQTACTLSHPGDQRSCVCVRIAAWKNFVGKGFHSRLRRTL